MRGRQSRQDGLQSDSFKVMTPQFLLEEQDTELTQGLCRCTEMLEGPTWDP